MVRSVCPLRLLTQHKAREKGIDPLHDYHIRDHHDRLILHHIHHSFHLTAFEWISWGVRSSSLGFGLDVATVLERG